MKLTQFKRVVIKVGSELLVDQEKGVVREAWLNTLAEDIAYLRANGVEVLVVSSGAIALGRTVLKFPAGHLTMAYNKAAASVGQPRMMNAWETSLAQQSILTSQIQLTHGDINNGERRDNARETLDTLLKLGVVPIGNENDTIATEEIAFGDNDRLGAYIAELIGADALVLLSDIDGLYTAAPDKDPNAKHIPFITRVTPEIEAMAGPARSEYSRGGMITKVWAAKTANDAGCAMAILNGRVNNPLKALDSGARCTWFGLKAA